MHCRLDDAAALEAQIRESEAAHPVGLLGDVVVLRNGSRVARVNTPAIEQNALLRWTVKFEGGGGHALRRGACLGSARARLAPAGRQVVRAARPAVAGGSAARLPPPRDRSRISRGGRAVRSSWRRTNATSPPNSPPARRLWGVAVQLYALRSREQLGHRRLLGSRRTTAPGGRGRRRVRRHQSRARAVSVRSDAVFAVLRVEPACAERHVHRRGRRCSKCRARAARRPSWRDPGFRARLRRCAPPRRWTTPRSPVSR